MTSDNTALSLFSMHKTESNKGGADSIPAGEQMFFTNINQMCRPTDVMHLFNK